MCYLRSTAGAAGALRGWVLLPELRQLLELGAGVGVGILFVWGCQGREKGFQEMSGGRDKPNV